MAFVDRCLTAQDVLENARRVRERRRALYHAAPKVEPAKPESVPVEINSFSGTVAARFQDQIAVERQPEIITIRQIQNAICRAFQINLNDLLSPRRHQKITYARQIGYGLCRVLTAKSYPEIGRRFGKRDHSTVLHGCAKVKPLIERAKAQLPDNATVDDWAFKLGQLATEFPELAPFANCYFSKFRGIV